jgi:hypothetical protein
MCDRRGTSTFSSSFYSPYTLHVRPGIAIVLDILGHKPKPEKNDSQKSDKIAMGNLFARFHAVYWRHRSNDIVEGIETTCTQDFVRSSSIPQVVPVRGGKAYCL